MTIETIKDLKEMIKNLPDDMPVMGYKGGNGDSFPVGAFTLTKKDMTEEELKDGYPDGFTDTFFIDID